MSIKRVIKNEKRNKLYCMMVALKDKKVINKLIDNHTMVAKSLVLIRNQIPLFVEYGVCSVNEGFEIHKHINAALKVMSERNADETANRIIDLSIHRIADLVGGEVVEEGKEES